MRVNTDIFCNMYADDTVIICNDMEASVAVEKSRMAFMSIQKWCECNRIVVNKTKTRHMLVGVKKREESEERMSIDGIVLVENYLSGSEY